MTPRVEGNQANEISNDRTNVQSQLKTPLSLSSVQIGRMSCCLSLALRLFCCCFVSAFFVFIKAAALRSIVPRYAYAPAATRNYLTSVCVLLICFFNVSSECRFLRVFFTIAEVPSTFSFRMVFSHSGWILTSGYYVRT